MEHIQKAMLLKADLDKLRPLDKGQEARIMQKFRLDWNYHSNHLEGNSLTFGETKALLLHGITAQGKPLKDHIEITGHNEAVNWIIDVVKEDYPLNESFIRQLHTLLLKESYQVNTKTADGQPTKKRVEVGKYKSLPNHVETVTGEVFYFATPEETPAKMEELINWFRTKKSEIETNPIFLAADFHYKFILIHPFDDGNGRTARILMNFILMQYGYPPVIIKTEDKTNYFAALQQGDAGLIEQFVEYIAQNLVRSLEIMIAGAKGEDIEEPDDIDKEIALLEHKLKGIGKKSEVVKSEISVMNIFDDSVSKLWSTFIDKCKKIDKYYKVNGCTMTINDLKLYGEKDINAYRQVIKSNPQNINQITLNYHYRDFNVKDIDSFGFDNDILVKFEETKYIVKSEEDSGNSIMFEKNYTEQLTEKEILEIVKFAIRFHMRVINNKTNSGK